MLMTVENTSTHGISSCAMTLAPTPLNALVATEDDSRLMTLAGQGDQKAFAELMSRHLLRTVRLAARLSGSDAQADDIAQEAFMRVWRHAARWQDAEQRGARFTTWLYKIVLNLVIDAKRKRQTVAIDDLPEAADEATPNAETALQRRQERQKVEAALRQLPDRQRDAFVLCFYEEYSNREAAEALDVSVKALESLLVRARRTLRDLLTTEVTP